MNTNPLRICFYYYISITEFKVAYFRDLRHNQNCIDSEEQEYYRPSNHRIHQKTVNGEDFSLPSLSTSSLLFVLKLLREDLCSCASKMSHRIRKKAAATMGCRESIKSPIFPFSTCGLCHWKRRFYLIHCQLWSSLLQRILLVRLSQILR